MPTANEILYDALVVHRINVSRLARNQERELWKLLDATEPEIEARLRELKDAYDEGFAKVAIAGLLLLILNARERAWAEVETAMTQRALEFAEGEPDFYADTITEALPVVYEVQKPATDDVKAEMLLAAFAGFTLASWIVGLRNSDAARIEQQINLGLAMGNSSETLVRRVTGSRSLGKVDGATAKTRNQLSAIFTTVLAGISDLISATMVTFNKKVFTYERYTAVLDARTTILCASLDGKRYMVGVGPIPPLHPNCRSVRIPIVRTVDIFGMPVKPGLKDLFFGMDKVRRTAKLRELIGESLGTTYEEFLRRQSAEFQDIVLGKARGIMFRNGEIKSLGSFLAPNGTNLTLEQLRKREKSTES